MHRVRQAVGRHVCVVVPAQTGGFNGKSIYCLAVSDTQTPETRWWSLPSQNWLWSKTAGLSCVTFVIEDKLVLYLSCNHCSTASTSQLILVLSLAPELCLVSTEALVQLLPIKLLSGSVLWSSKSFQSAELNIIVTVASFPGCSHLQYLVACSMQILRGKAWEYKKGL